jgi:CheY-like chemotaxis protein
MLSQILNTLQTILIPLVIGLLIVGAVAIWWVGRPLPRKDARHEPAPDVHADTEPPDAAVAVPGPAARTSPATAAPAVPLAADLLLVDDSAVVRAKLRRLFEPAGYRVALARDGQEALQLLALGRYALMVTDLEMPKLDGVGLINAVQGQAATAQMPIMAITGHDDLQARLDECREICGIYRKPWIDEDLLGHVQSLVGSRSTDTVCLDER